MRHVLDLEAQNEKWKQINEDDARRQAQVGIQVISFDAVAARQFRDKAYEVGWTSMIKASPVYGPQMRKLFSR